MRNRVFRGSHIFSLQVKCVAMIFAVAVFIMPLAAVVSAKMQPATTGKGVKKMLILGDSITKHAPAKDLGWTGDWGMAASSEDKDFVHLLYAKLCASQEEKPELIASGVGGGTIADKLANLPAITAHAADLVIIQLGENDRTVTEEGFEKPYETLIEAAKKANPAVRVYCCSVWAEGAGGKNEMIQNACLRQGAVFVDISQVFLDSRGYASSEGRFTNSGVNWHPGDKGMQGYA
ncbi:MAG: SGNH/GDSL hydrolase family protein, partial [Lentisphaerae bacterium]|nr:SGNH/GDSL hydrolase family protein [Lentisphaerota bacterium]